MLTIRSQMHMPGVRGEQVVDFMLDSSDERYQAWWPGTHLAMHRVNAAPGVGQVVLMDEYVGTRRLTMYGRVTKTSPTDITWQLRRVVTLPCWVSIELEDDATGASITHTIRAGFDGVAGRLLDPLFRIYFSRRFACQMEEHFTGEFSRLSDLLQPPAFGGVV